MNELKIIKTEIENFKNLKAKSVDIDGKSIMVIGANQEGKSSFIQALMSPFLSTYKPLKAITEGEERGSVSVVIGGDIEGEEVEYTVEMYFSPEFQKGRLKMFTKDGAEVKGAKGVLDSIVGDISFDIDLFLQQAKTPSGGRSKEGVKRQIEMLKSFMPKEIIQALDQCDVDRLAKYNERSELNSEIKVLEGQNVHGFSDEELEKYSEAKDSTEIDAKMNDIGAQIEGWNKVSSGVPDFERKFETNKVLINSYEATKEKHDATLSFIESLEGHKNEQETSIVLTHANSYLKIQREKMDASLEAKKENKDLELKIERGVKWLEKNPEKPSMDSLLKEQKEIQEHNQKHSEVMKMIERHKTVKEKKDLSDKLTEEINSFIKKKKQIFIDNPLPVEDLTFDEENVLYKGLPLNETQHPSSVIIEVGVAIAMAKNPNLKIIIIRDGSLLDKNLYNKILKMVEDNGFQLFIEMVDWNGNEMEVKFAEKV